MDVEKLIKRANQRLRQLEKDGLANQSKAYQFIMNKAQKNMASKTKVKQFAMTSKGEIKFRTDLATLKKANKNVYNAVIRLATGFTETKGSTKIGIEEKYKGGYETFKRLHGFTGTFEQYTDMWKNEEFKKLENIFKTSYIVEMGEDLADKFGITYEQAINDMAESKATSEMALYEYFEEKYRSDEKDEETV